MSNPITVVKSGSNTNNGSGSNILLNSNYPFTKLDTQNNASFQTISVLFSNEPPNPTATIGNYTQTLLYSFPHGYNYIPSIWLTWQNISFKNAAIPAVGSYATNYYAFGDESNSFLLPNIGSLGASENLVADTLYTAPGPLTASVTNAFIATTIDSNNVNIYLIKQTTSVVTSGGVPIAIPVNVKGYSLNMRCYVFTEPANSSNY